MYVIRKCVSRESAELLIHAFITSRLDNGNGLLYGISKNLVQKLQLLQNAAAHCICMVGNHDHISQHFRSSHWLPIEQRIIFKICLLTWKALHGLSPSYIQDLIVRHNPSYSGLRSADQNLLVIPKTYHKTLGDRSFSNSAPMLWNSLPLELRQCQNLNSFKSLLKSFLFTSAYSS